MGKNHNQKKKSTNMLIAAFMLFIFPIMLVFLGVFLGGYLGKLMEGAIRIYQIVGGIIALVLAVVFVKLFDKTTIVDKEQEKFYWEDM
ncbi:SoxR reducing system RseC family protein [Clostridium kluyveri]|uniref:Fis family transcriptional regulator n=1 Tax=Clostridium kluyveri TaxID=1534 RepID=A0A1L5FAK2_CLOKL|nr:SoxR reducing system RseC family protein [Clostridium kluyveri]APM40045.1 Fis family transcriptional regulator [Clostridium kluyveri]UZQ49715.1 SoxR reducing system RseC family protein [Clostridium kluyveri]